MPARFSRSPWLLAPLAAALSFMLVLGSAVAQDEGTPVGPPIVDDETTRAYPAAIHAGSCDEPGDAVYELSIIGIPEGGEIVGEPAIPAYLGVTEIPDVTIDDLANGEHVFVIFQSTANEAAQAGDSPRQEIVACGLIGGTRFGDSLLFSVPPVEDPLYGAVVEMSAVDGAVTVTTYLTISLLGDDPEAIVDDATPGAETES